MAIPNIVPASAHSKVKLARERSLGVHGAKLFYVLQIHLRNENSGDFPLFKNHLDIFLSMVPDTVGSIYLPQSKYLEYILNVKLSELAG